MVDVYATGKANLIAPQEYTYPDQWAHPLNSNFLLTGATVSGTTTINVASISSSNPIVTLAFKTFADTQTPWLSPNAGQNLRISVTGTLAFDITIIIPKNIPGMWIFQNATSGGFKVNVKTDDTNANTIAILQGYMSLLFCDGIRVYYADAGGVVANTPSSVAIGTILAFGGATLPTGYLLCDGGIYTNTTYPSLYAAIGTAWNIGGEAAGSFRVPDLIGYFPTGAGTVKGTTITRTLGKYAGDTFGSHTHVVHDPGHSHQVQGSQWDNSKYPGNNGTAIPASVYTAPGYTGISIDATGDVETVPKNAAVNYMIRAF